MALSTKKCDLFGISLCAGLGGLELGLSIAEPRYRTVCYVERQAFAAATLVARMADQTVCDAPVWDDVASFDGKPWRGKVDILSAGYPCQPFSSSGQRRGSADERHLWPHVARIIGECRPRRVFCENVEGHVNLGLPEVIADLQGMGYRVKAGLFSAYECGASHQRRRLLIMADADGGQLWDAGRFQADGRENDLLPEPRYDGKADRLEGSRPKLDDVMAVHAGDGDETDRRLPALFPPAPCDYSAWARALEISPDLQPCLFGMGDGLAHGMERHHAAGNGVFPLAAALAYHTLANA